MPKKHRNPKEGTRQALQNTSFEQKVVGWLMQGGWQVFRPVLDNGHATDILISDGPSFYRIQIKTIDSTQEDRNVENKWKDSHLDYVIYFSRKSDWGYVMPAFETRRRRLNAAGHLRFLDQKRSFLSAFHQV